MERLAVIKSASLGWCLDRCVLTMQFSTYINESMAAGQSISGIDLEKAFADTKAPNVEWFIGKACWVECDDSERTVNYLRMFKP